MDEPHSEPPPPSESEPEPAEQPLDRRMWRRLTRRELLKLSPVVLAGAFLVPGLRTPLLRGGMALSDRASGLLFGENRLAPTFASSAVAPFETFPYNTYDVDDPGVDLKAWTLTVEGLVRRPGRYRLDFIRDLPKITQNVRHVCVEGWDVIGSFGGARVSDFLRAVGADPRARFVVSECADDYYESLDMPTALHPQSLLC